jgi:peptide chain release factor subunit 1
MPQLEQISTRLDRLAIVAPGRFPVVSLYLNLQPNQYGRDQFEPFLRKEFTDRVRTYGAHGPERRSLEQDAERIRAYVNDVEPSANGAAIFACSGSDLFEAMQLAAPIPQHRLYISDQPHLYPLARILDEYPRYAVLVTDTHLARMFVCAANTIEKTAEVENAKTKRHKMGGWSQARYQRHVDNFHLRHVKEVVDVLGRVVREEDIRSVVLAGDEVIVPLIREHMPKNLAECVVDVMKLDIRANDREVLDATIERMREIDAISDRERVDLLLDAYRADGLAVVGLEQTRQALEIGQVDELLITSPESIDTGPPSGIGRSGDRMPEERVADELIAKARQTAAAVRFIEDASLLAGVGGVGALLRYKI